MLKDAEKHKEYMRKYMLARYHSRRREAKKALGGLCVKCGSNKNLEIDHVNRKKKNFSIGKLWGVAKAKFNAELKLCQLLCKSCHIEKTLKERGQVSARLEHGTLSSYRYCRCTKCCEAKKRYNRRKRKQMRP